MSSKCPVHTTRGRILFSLVALVIVAATSFGLFALVELRGSRVAGDVGASSTPKR